MLLRKQLHITVHLRKREGYISKKGLDAFSPDLLQYILGHFLLPSERFRQCAISRLFYHLFSPNGKYHRDQNHKSSLHNKSRQNTANTYNTRYIFNPNTDFYYWLDCLSKYYSYNSHYQHTKKKKKNFKKVAQNLLRVQLLYFLIYQYQILTAFQAIALHSSLMESLKEKWKRQQESSNDKGHLTSFEDMWTQFIRQLQDTQRLSLHGNAGTQMSHNSDAQTSLLLFVCYFLRFSHTLSPLRVLDLSLNNLQNNHVHRIAVALLQRKSSFDCTHKFHIAEPIQNTSEDETARTLVRMRMRVCACSLSYYYFF
ncbi:hypothetical protein RFI_18062 [Reticulomyxa filosa]|uniref:Uncharacterized protein n=1 Tax=Reticulomyxa filosa TaxID=46433 RepID=X6MZB2_RETFI|nr:hypothetical protein RFI_18062 [Reticulomyxa filosa]|eukprot:ETO19171.1 hypothetical protein RFI_18062 [Reticulomyxa filosa]